MLEGTSATRSSETLSQIYQLVERSRETINGSGPSLSRSPAELDGSDADSEGRLPSIAVDGPGFLVLRTGSSETYARSGRFHFTGRGELVDEHGRGVLAYAQGAHADVQPFPLSDEGKNSAATRFSINEDGELVAVTRSLDPKKFAESSATTIVGKLCLAIFPAPDRLAHGADGTLNATAMSGKPSYVRAGELHCGKIRRGARELDVQTTRQLLHQLWMLSGRANLEIALAAAADGLQRIALNLVK